MTVIEIRPHRWGWNAFESPAVEPVFPEKDDAIDYAKRRACFRSGEIRVLDSTGNVERTIAFSETDRKLVITLPKCRMIRHNSCHAVQEERKD
jgi:hypothetical protein